MCSKVETPVSSNLVKEDVLNHLDLPSLLKTEAVMLNHGVGIEE